MVYLKLGCNMTAAATLPPNYFIKTGNCNNTAK